MQTKWLQLIIIFLVILMAVLQGNTYKKNYNFIFINLFHPKTFLEYVRLICAVIAPIIVYNKDHLYLLGGGWSFTLLFWWSCIDIFFEEPFEDWQLFIHQAVENLYIFELRSKLEVLGITTETTAQLHKELYDVLLGDKIKAASIELALEEPDYRKILEDDFFNKRGRFVFTFWWKLGLCFFTALGLIMYFM